MVAAIDTGQRLGRVVLPVAAIPHAELRAVDNRRRGGRDGERYGRCDDGRPHLYRSGSDDRPLSLSSELFRLVAAHNSQQPTSQHQTGEGTLR